MTYGEALNIAKEAFKGKKDRGGNDYYLHCYRVSQHVSLDTAVPAVLHDLLEDCPEWTEQRLLDVGIESRHLELIKLLTHNKEDSYEEYIDKISKDKDAIFIKVADLKDNMSVHRLKGLTDKDLERLKKYNKAYHKLVNIIINRDARTNDN